MGNDRILIPIFLLCCLMRLGSTAHAQAAPRWLAESIVMSNDGRHLAVQYVVDNFPGQFIVDQEEGIHYFREVWIYNLDDVSSPPRRLVDLKSNYAYGAMSFSPDSQQIAVADKRRLRVFSTEDLSPILDNQDTSNETSAYSIALSYSPDSRYIMSISYAWNIKGGEMSIWDIETGLSVYNAITYQPHQEYDERPWLSPNWHQFLDWSHSDKLSVYEFGIENGVGARLATISETAGGATFSPDSSLFALASPHGELHIFRTDTWDLIYIQALGENSCGGESVTMAFGHIRPWLVCYGEGWLLVWDIGTGELLLRDRPDGSFSHFSLDDSALFADYILYIPVDYVITAWDANDAFEKTIFPGLNPQLHPDGRLIAAINPDQEVWLWDFKSKEFLMILSVTQP